jgi:hypothetical protein
MTQLKIVVNRAVAFTEASRRDALSAMAFSSGQVTIMALIIICCIIFAIVLLCAVLVVRRREAHAKVRSNERGVIVATLPPPANGGYGVRKSSLTTNNSNHSLAGDNYYTDMPREASCPNSLSGISQASEDEASLFSPRPVSLISRALVHYYSASIVLFIYLFIITICDLLATNKHGSVFMWFFLQSEHSFYGHCLGHLAGQLRCSCT